VLDVANVDATCYNGYIEGHNTKHTYKEHHMVIITFETVKNTKTEETYIFAEINGNIYECSYGYNFVMDSAKTREEVQADTDKFIKSKGW
jgi:hypothetical protein